jgi:hypothetical protein
MWWSRALILWIGFCSGCVSGAAESFTIGSSAAAGRIEVRYGLSGAFGYYGGFVRERDKDGAYRIPLEGDGKPAKTLKAILYAEGCQFSVLAVDLLSDPTRSETFECVPLSKIPLHGRISPRPTATGALDVEIYYVAAWDHKFFGFGDGMVQMFSLGKAPLDAEGRFEIPIADFSKDRITNERKDAYLQLIVREHSTWNTVKWVVPPADLQYENMGLKILPWYGSEIPFEGRR